MTFARIQELRRERVELHKKATDLLNNATEESRAADIVAADKIFVDIDLKGKEVEVLERALGIEQQLSKGDTRVVQPVLPGEEKTSLVKRAFESAVMFEKRSRGNLSPEVRQDCLDIYRNYLLEGRSAVGSEEKRALLQAGSDIGGGYFIMNQEMAGGILKKMDNEIFIRAGATKFQVPKAESLGQVSLENDPDDFEWTTELKTGSEDTATSFGLRELYPHAYAKRLKVSEKLMRSSVIDVEAVVEERIRYKAGQTEEKAFLTGPGTAGKKPLGIMTPSDDGIPTSRDVVCGSATDFLVDKLIDAVYSLKSQYLAEAVFGLSREGLKRLRKLKTGEGQFIWSPGLQAGQPDLILGRPFFASENMPATFTTGLYVGFFGCLKYYYIADALDMRIQRLDELYAETNQVGYIFRKECDAMPVLAEAFSRLILA